jgi:hypothetical protein
MMTELFKKPEVGPAAIQKLAYTERHVFHKWLSKRSELEALERETIEALADAVLADTATVGENVTLQKVRSESSDLRSVLATIRQRRIVALQKTRATRVAEMRDECSAKRAHLDELNRKSAALVAKLSSLENVEMDAAKLLALPPGEWNGFAQLLSTRLRFEADNLGMRADRLAAESLPGAGAAQAADLPAICDAILSDSSVVTPELPAVERWMSECIERAEIFGASQYPAPLQKPSGSPSFHLEWRDGKILENSSYVEVFNARITSTGVVTVLPQHFEPQVIGPAPIFPPLKQHWETFQHAS